ncbi:YbjN domain-containing protein [Paraburkholderia sp. BL21I4N1]|uniref:YbjN domain-containing protein n=1 Tax=Paraburkholderia sp. BL21I4N1 TaxID=1938801 RepID=UPI000CFDB5BA|nr:YbjN domain-containing protein [Paraburkholderia sp. BL21I4N1]PQV46079.1 putative sensory transduction regulator [Paraburkholderia sp. BL21I4N1]
MSDKQTKAVAEQAPGSDLIEAVSIDRLADILKAAGYRVTVAEQNGAVQLMSASQGVGFSVRFGNPVQEASAATVVRYLDYTHSCVLQVQGELPRELVASWNRTKRFARLADHGPFLALEMDVIVAGGVTERYLRSTIELWDRLIQEFLLHLRNRPALAEQQAGSRATSAVAAPAATATDPAPAAFAGEDADAAVRESGTRERALAP